MVHPKRLQRLLEFKEIDWKRRLADGACVERKLNEVIAHERDLLDLLGSTSPTAALFSDLTLNQLQAAARRKSELQDLRSKKLAEANAAGMSVKALERLSEKINDSARSDAAAKELRSAIDLSLHPSTVRLR